VVVKNVEYKSYLTTLFESVLFKDIVKRYNVRHSKKLYDLGLYLITNHSTLFSCTSLKNFIGFRSVHTVENYLEYLKEAFIVFNVWKFSYKVKEQVKSPKKTYSYDPGVINAVKYRISQDTGRLIENVVDIELLRRGKESYYYKTKDGKEVDFVVKEGLAIRKLMEVCYNMDTYQTLKREVNALIKVAGETKCEDMAVLTWDYEAEEKIGDKKVLFLPLWKWLIGG